MALRQLGLLQQLLLELKLELLLEPLLEPQPSPALEPVWIHYSEPLQESLPQTPAPQLDYKGAGGAIADLDLARQRYIAVTFCSSSSGG